MMEIAELKALRARWTPDQTVQAEDALSKNSRSPFPLMPEELADFRGLEITKMIHHTTINSVDLSGIKFERFGQFDMCNVDNGRFISACMQTNIGGKFNACDFTLMNASGAVLRGLFVDCNFSRANLSSTRGREVRFVRCVFFKTNFSKVVLLHCSFEDCRFEECIFRKGSLSYSKFIRSQISKDNLGSTLMEKVVFE